MSNRFTYDNAGNLLKDDKAKYTYDAFNQTEKVETFDGHVQINRYDAEGLRHEMEEDGRLVQFIFRGDEIAVEAKDSSVIHYPSGHMPACMKEAYDKAIAENNRPGIIRCARPYREICCFTAEVDAILAADFICREYKYLRKT